MGVEGVCLCVTREMFGKETDLNTAPRTSTATMTLYKQELRKATTKAKNTNLLNSTQLFPQMDSSKIVSLQTRWSCIPCRQRGYLHMEGD